MDLQDLWKEGGGDDAGKGPAEPLEDGYKRQFGGKGVSVHKALIDRG